MSTEEEKRSALAAVIEDPAQVRRRQLVESVIRERPARLGPLGTAGLVLRHPRAMFKAAFEAPIPGYRAAFEEPWTVEPGVRGTAVRAGQALAKAAVPETVGSAALMAASAKPLQMGAQFLAKTVPKIPGFRWTATDISPLWDWFLKPLPAPTRPTPPPPAAAPAPTGLAVPEAHPSAPGLVAQAVERVRTGMDDVLKVVAPAMRGPVAEYTALALRNALGKLSRDTEMAQARLDEAVLQFDYLPKDVTRAFMYHMEEPGTMPLPFPEHAAFAQTMRGLFQQREQALP